MNGQAAAELLPPDFFLTGRLENKTFNLYTFRRELDGHNIEASIRFEGEDISLTLSTGVMPLVRENQQTFSPISKSKVRDLTEAYMNNRT